VQSQWLARSPPCVPCYLGAQEHEVKERAGGGLELPGCGVEELCWSELLLRLGVDWVRVEGERGMARFCQDFGSGGSQCLHPSETRAVL
jgi:hypothetical protein